MRRLVAALIIVVIFAAGWVGGWFWLAQWIDRHADPALQRIAERGIEVDCPNRAVVGFPFALRVACGETAVAERSTGTHADLAGATGGASVFHPMTAKLALQSPVRVESPLLNGPVELRWTDAAVDVGLGMNGPKDVVFDASDLLGAFTVPGYPEQTVAATSAKARLAPSPDGGSTVALTFTDLAFTSGGTRFPPLTGSANAELSVPPHALAAGRAGIELPVEARGIQVMVESGGARFMIEGDLSLGPGGVVDGTIVIRIAGIEAFHDFIASLPEQLQRASNGVIAGLLLSGQPTTIDGQQGTEVRVAIEASRARIGLLEFPLPRLPL
jgi:hypothetical protein